MLLGYFRVMDPELRGKYAALNASKAPLPVDPKLNELRNQLEYVQKPIQPDPTQPTQLLNQILQFTFGYAPGATAGQVAAPPCIQQGKHTEGGAVPGQYPHVDADPNGNTP